MRAREEIYFFRGMENSGFKGVIALVTLKRIPLRTLNKIKFSPVIKTCGVLRGPKQITEDFKNYKGNRRHESRRRHQ